MAKMLALAAQHSTSTLPMMLDVAQVGEDRYMCATASFNSPKVSIFSWSVAPTGEVVGLVCSNVIMSAACEHITHVYRTNDEELPARVRFVASLRNGQVKQIGETEEEDDDADDEPVDLDRLFRELPYRLSEASPWDCATTLCRRPECFVASLPGPVLRVLELRHDGHLQPTRSVEVGGLSGESFSKLQGVAGDSNSVMGICHRSVVTVDLRAASPVAAITDALQWSPHDPLTCFSVRDTSLMAGTESGAVVVWDLRTGSRRLADSSSLSESVAVVGIHAMTTSSFVTAGADGVLLQWFRQQSTGEFSPAQVHPQPSTFPFGGVPYVDLVALNNQICTIDAGGVFSIFSQQ